MQSVIIVVHLIIVLVLIGVVLLQKSEGGALGMGGGGGFMTGRGQANALTRATAILAGLFFITSLALTIIANFNRAPKSILEGATPVQQQGEPGAAPAATSGGLLDQLKQIEEQKQQQQQQAPAAPEPPRQ
jgi:preprotein translocase subunit SecG